MVHLLRRSNEFGYEKNDGIDVKGQTLSERLSLKGLRVELTPTKNA